MFLPFAFRRRKGARCKEFSVQQTFAGCEFNIHSVETLRALLLKHRPVRYKPLVALLRSGMRHRVMIVADGEDWQRTHEAIVPELHAALSSGQFASSIRDVAEETFARLAQASATDLPAVAIEFEVEPVMRAIASSALGQILFGRILAPPEAESLEKMLGAATKVYASGTPFRINRAIGALFRALNVAEHQPVVFPTIQRQAVHDLLHWIGARIDEAERSPVRPPLLESLKTRYAHLNPSRRRQAITAEYCMLFTAGIETTAASLTFAIAEIANSPEVREAVVKEARRDPAAESPSHSQALTLQFPYLHCVFRESLRRHTIVPTLLRETEAEYHVSGEVPGTGSPETVQVRRGSTLRHLSIVGHMRRGIWPEPHSFVPERFARPLTAEQATHYMPFGFGAQRCPGHAMATTEAILILVAFFRRFDLETQKIEQEIPAERNVMFTTRPIGVTARVRAASSPGL
jgi:cytochrome P450